MRDGLDRARAAITHLEELTLPDEAAGPMDALREVLDAEQGWFPITHLHREDLTREQVGLTPKQAYRMTDADMRWIARKMGDAYTGYGDFWDDLGRNADRAAEKYEEDDSE